MYNNHTQNPAIRLASPLASPLSGAGLERSATNSDNKTAERFAGQENAPQKSRAERLAALDKLMSDFDRKAEWISTRLHRSLNSDRWVNCWRARTVPKSERAEFERIIAHLRSRDPVLRRAIGAIEWHQGVTVALNQGGSHHG